MGVKEWLVQTGKLHFLLEAGFEMQWYPNENKAAALIQSLENGEKSWHLDCVTHEIYQQISLSIRRLVELAESDPYLIHDWVWVAARLRIAHPHNEATARKAWAGIAVFLGIVSKMDSGDRELLPTLRWLTDRVTEDLVEAIGPHAVDRFVSPVEQKRIDDLLLELAEANEPDLQILLPAAEKVADDLSSVHHSAYFPTVANKLRGLVKLGNDETEKGYWARAGLRYVYLEHDVIDDAHGYIGFLDDIQVVEDIHELIHGELSWRALIDHAISKWPALARIHWTDGETTNHLPPFLKAAAVCALESTIDDKLERVIVAPEIGPLGLVSAVLCALSDLKTESRTRLPTPGTVVTFRQGHFVRFAEMAQSFDAGDGIVLPMVKLRNSTISVPAQYAAILEPATVDNPKLATVTQFNEWMRTLESDKLTPIWKYRRVGVRPSVLYVTDRSKFFAMMDQVRPFGRRIDDLVPVAYHTRGGRTTIGTGAATVAPAMTVCNDLATAEASINVAAEEDRLPRYVMIDRTVDPESLRSLTHRCRELDSGIRVVTFAMPGATRNLVRDERNTSIWLIRPEEIDPLPTENPRQRSRGLGSGPLETFNRRQVSATNVDIKTVPVKFDELDHFATLAAHIVCRAHREQDPDMEVVAFACEATLRQISGHPPLGRQLTTERIDAALKNVSALVGVHGLFNKEVAELGEASERLRQGLSSFHPKDQLLRDVLEQHPSACVLVGSRALAEKMNEKITSSSKEKIRFLAPHDLEQVGNINVLVVPSWFGTREMRRIMFGGWAPLQIRVLFTYEIDRLKRLSNRLERELNYLAQRTRRSWAIFSQKRPDLVPPPSPPEGNMPIAETATETSHVPEAASGEDDADWLEVMIRNRLVNTNKSGVPRDLVTARLVFFDDGRNFGVFARDASLICLNEVIGGGADLNKVDEKEAEKLLWKKTNFLVPGDVLAFPDDSSYGDVIDELSDALIGDGGETRRLAGLWRAAVQTVIEQCHGDLAQARQKLVKFGVDREVSTLSAWLYSTKTVAPQKPEETIPALMKCAGRNHLTERTEDVLKATSAVYSSRKKAGHVLIGQLSSASVDASSGTAYVEIGGKQVRYRLLTVSTVDDAASFAPSVLGLHTTEDKIPEANS